MATSESLQNALESYTVQPLNLTIRVGDDIVLKAPVRWNRQIYVARILEIYETKGKKKELSNTRVKVCWYYQPEELEIGRQPYHGAKELVNTNHVDVQSPKSIEGKCIVHNLESYIALGVAREEDYFSRSSYDIFTKAFQLNVTTVYCVCNMLYNPDQIMVQCEACQQWFHPRCVHMTNEQVRNVENFFCDPCRSSLRMPNTVQIRPSGRRVVAFHPVNFPN